MKMNVNKIKLEIKRLGWSQTDLAATMKVDRQYVWWAFNRGKNHTLGTIERFAKALRLDPKDLII